MSVKVAILAGGFGTRLKEETVVKPKPMVEIGGRPILWHIMKMYSHCGFNNFVICLGYKGEVIKDYFLRYQYVNNDFTISLKNNSVELEGLKNNEDWKITLADTGLMTQTGGRIKRIEKYVGNETFMVTYGDGVANIDVKEVLEFHKKHGKIATVTAVRPPSRFGELLLKEDLVEEFSEKPLVGSGWINGGFFVFEPQIFDYIKGDNTYLEREPLEKLAKERQLAAYLHKDYWRCVDTHRDLEALNMAWENKKAGWKIW